MICALAEANPGYRLQVEQAALGDRAGESEISRSAQNRGWNTMVPGARWCTSRAPPQAYALLGRSVADLEAFIAGIGHETRDARTLRRVAPTSLRSTTNLLLTPRR